MQVCHNGLRWCSHPSGTATTGPSHRNPHSEPSQWAEGSTTIGDPDALGRWKVGRVLQDCGRLAEICANQRRQRCQEYENTSATCNLPTERVQYQRKLHHASRAGAIRMHVLHARGCHNLATSLCLSIVCTADMLCSDNRMGTGIRPCLCSVLAFPRRSLGPAAALPAASSSVCRQQGRLQTPRNQSYAQEVVT